jgi:hypothetical protein
MVIAPRAREASVQISLQFDRSRTADSAAQDVQAAIMQRRPAAADDAKSADPPQDQPGRHAGPDADLDLGDAAADQGQRLREQHPGAETVMLHRR